MLSLLRVVAHLRSLGIPEERLLSFDRGEHLRIGSAELIAVHAEHTEDSIGPVIRADRQTVYFTADTLYEEILVTRVKPFAPEILVVCVNGCWGNMNADEAARLARALGVKVAIPTHYGIFAENTANPAGFVEKMGGRGRIVLNMYQPTCIDPSFYLEET